MERIQTAGFAVEVLLEGEIVLQVGLIARRETDE